MSPSPPPTVVWFKRDLRVSDHEPLWEAAQRGPVVALYIYEPELLVDECTHSAHYAFINGCLAELDQRLRELGGCLTIRRGEAVEVLESLRAETNFQLLVSHQETGKAVTYARDLRVKRWAQDSGVAWREYRQHGVFRGQTDRDGWSARWERSMRAMPVPPVQRLAPYRPVGSYGVATLETLGLEPLTRTVLQPPGERAAFATLSSFLEQRGETYQKAMSSPELGETACSRLSPYIAYGAISIRTVYQAYLERIETVRALQREGVGGLGSWARALSSFNKRLHWNGHFIQRLESDPSIEHHNLVRSFDVLRDDSPNETLLEAWKTGHTGYPMVDACMRYLNATGWLNFRMRAMVVSFASYHLWLPWQLTGKHLAKQFLDYEPGIHYNQLQMQSGVTGINAVRIYSPTKQALDQDPDGHFIRRWVPELQAVPARCLAEPHTMDMIEQLESSFQVGVTYPLPIVDHRQAVASAKEQIFAVRRTAAAREQAKDVLKRHGSRRKRSTSRRKRSTTQTTKRVT